VFGIFRFFRSKNNLEVEIMGVERSVGYRLNQWLVSRFGIYKAGPRPDAESLLLYRQY
jgi:hypothetical protein